MIYLVPLFFSLMTALLPGPEVLIVFSGEELGRLEPCGCEERPMGGVSKRHSLLLSLKGENRGLLPVSLGDPVGDTRRQDEIKAETFSLALQQMDYTVHNLGEKDLELGEVGLGYIFYYNPVELLSSNVRLSSTTGLEVRSSIVKEIELGGRKIKVGLLGVLSPGLIRYIPAGVEVNSPAESLRPLVKELKGRADLLVLLSHSELEESLKLAETFPEFHIIISGHGLDQPNTNKVGNTLVASCGIKGRHVGVYRYSPLKESGEFEMIPLDSSYPDSGPMLSLLRTYQQRLKDEDLLSKVEKLSLPEGAAYTGSPTCGPCHQTTSIHWDSTAHASAYERLAKAGHEYDPECVPCHVTGLYYITGFESLEKTPYLRGVGCEACHGPGGRHKEEASMGLKTTAYGEMKPADCETCHDPEHSPSFEFETYWERIAHPEEEPKG